MSACTMLRALQGTESLKVFVLAQTSEWSQSRTSSASWSFLSSSFIKCPKSRCVATGQNTLFAGLALPNCGAITLSLGTRVGDYHQYTAKVAFTGFWGMQGLTPSLSHTQEAYP